MRLEDQRTVHQQQEPVGEGLDPEGGGGSGAFVPPRPIPFRRRLPLPEIIRRVRRNLLELWHEAHFSADLIPTSLLGRSVLVCNSPASVREAFLDHQEALERKTPRMRHALEPLVGDGLIISDGLVWKERRRVVAPVTHVSRMAELAPAMTEAATEHAARWAALPPGAPVDMLAEMGTLAAEVICRSVFGGPLGAEAAGEVVGAFAAYQRKARAGILADLIGLPGGIAARLGAWPLRAEVRRIHAVLDRLVAEVLARPGPPCLLLAMAEAHRAAHGRPMSPEPFRNEAATLFLAGHETTAATLAWAWYLLSQDPAAAERLRQEAREALGDRPASPADLPHLPYARAVVEETLRLYPPIPLLAREAQRATNVAGQAVPKGGIVMVVPWLLHRHRRLWVRPDHFEPERFLPGGSAEGRPKNAYVPFSLGPRVCTGAAFAMAETVIVLATLAPRFAPALAPEAKVFPVARLTLKPGDTLPMRLERVEA
jgi:cytochrome P450